MLSERDCKPSPERSANVETECEYPGSECRAIGKLVLHDSWQDRPHHTGRDTEEECHRKHECELRRKGPWNCRSRSYSQTDRDRRPNAHASKHTCGREGEDAHAEYRDSCQKSRARVADAELSLDSQAAMDRLRRAVDEALACPRIALQAAARPRHRTLSPGSSHPAKLAVLPRRRH